MDKNFKVRTVVAFGMFVVAIISLYTFNSIPFRIVYSLFSLMAMIELFSFFTKKVTTTNTILALFELGFLIGGTIFAAKVDLHDFWYVVFGVCGYDIFAYIFGKIFGGKVFKTARPFPHVSKNKTWEGTILGLLMSFLLVLVYMFATGDSDFIFLLCGPLAVIGDLFESLLKRKFGVKDSNEIIIKYKVFHGLEYIVGGSDGHGGFLDRIDSVAFTATVLALLTYLIL